MQKDSEAKELKNSGIGKCKVERKNNSLPW